MSEPVETSRDERNMAALAQSVGIVAALPVWVYWRRRSAFVRAHAVQSMLFDVVTLSAMLLVALLVPVALFMPRFPTSAPPPGNYVLQDWQVGLVAMVCLPAMALAGLAAIMLAALVLRLRAAVAATQGRLFRYPLLGKAQRPK